MAVVFLLDVDNTLLDNDRAKTDLADRVAAILPAAEAARFWELYEELRVALGVVDYPAMLRRLSALYPGDEGDERALRLEACVNDFPYDEFLYPQALEVLARLRTFGTTVILSDGDAVYQPRKIARAGLTAAVGGNVIVTTQKEAHLAEVTRRFPADRYVMVDDKAPLLAAAKARLGAQVLTVHVCQGHYAREAAPIPPDLSLAAIGDLLAVPREAFTGAARSREREARARAEKRGS